MPEMFHRALRRTPISKGSRSMGSMEHLLRRSRVHAATSCAEIQAQCTNMLHTKSPGRQAHALTCVFAGGCFLASAFTVHHVHTPATYWWLVDAQHPRFLLGGCLSPGAPTEPAPMQTRPLVWVSKQLSSLENLSNSPAHPLPTSLR